MRANVNSSGRRKIERIVVAAGRPRKRIVSTLERHREMRRALRVTIEGGVHE